MSNQLATHNFKLSQRSGWAAGQPISELMSRALANPDLISLAAGFVDQQTLPTEPTQIALENILSDVNESRAALQYGTTPGYPPLRDALLSHIVEQDGVTPASLSTDQVVVTAGSNQLLHLVAESLLDPGDIVLCAAPTYLVFLGTVSNVGGRSIGVACDDEGMIPDALEAELQQIESAGELSRVKAIYLVPYFDNPRGLTMPLERRAAIVEIAKQWSKKDDKIHVIADAAYRALRYEGDDIPSTQSCDEDGDTVIVAGTFSKSYSPGIRVGWGILPKHLVAPVCDQKGNFDFGSPNFCQHLISKVIELGLLMPHIERIRDGYRKKRDTMLAAADEWLGSISGVSWTKPSGGLYIWAELPEHIDTGPDGTLFDVAIEEGMMYVPGQFAYATEGEKVAKNTMRLSFGVQSCEGIRKGIQSLARAIDRVS